MDIFLLIGRIDKFIFQVYRVQLNSDLRYFSELFCLIYFLLNVDLIWCEYFSRQTQLFVKFTEYRKSVEQRFKIFQRNVLLDLDLFFCKIYIQYDVNILPVKKWIQINFLLDMSEKILRINFTLDFLFQIERKKVLLVYFSKRYFRQKNSLLQSRKNIKCSIVNVEQWMF